MKTYWGVEIRSTHSWPRHQMKVRCQLHAPAALHPGWGPQKRSGWGGEEKRFHSFPCRKLNTCRPTRSLATILTELTPLLFSQVRFSNMAAYQKRMRIVKQQTVPSRYGNYCYIEITWRRRASREKTCTGLINELVTSCNLFTSMEQNLWIHTT